MERKVTQSFVGANSITLALIPVLKTKTGTGHTTVDGTPRAVQTFRLIDQSTEIVGNTPGRLRSSDGQNRKITHMLLGFWDAAMEAGDYWLDASGARYEIDEMLPDNGYERRAKVIRYGL
jgi:hypothetical protein